MAYDGREAFEFLVWISLMAININTYITVQDELSTEVKNPGCFLHVNDEFTSRLAVSVERLVRRSQRKSSKT